MEGSSTADEEMNGEALEVDEEELEDGAAFENEMEEGEEEEEEEEEEEGEEDQSYNLEFYGEMDPLDFALKDSYDGGGEIYQQFQRIEYEALAEKKRKALLDPQSRTNEQEKRLREEEGAAMEVINEFMNLGRRRRRRTKEPKKRGRKKGSKKNLNPEVIRKIGDATLHYASENYDEAVCLLEEIVRLAPCSPDAYYMLGLIYDAKGDRKKALNFHMIAAHLTPKDPSLWKKLVAWSMEQNNTGQVRYCLSKAITADPKDVGLRFDLASLYFELGEYQRAAGLYSQIVELYPGNIVACKMAARMYQKCGLLDRAVSILEDFVKDHGYQVDQTVINLLITLQMESNEYMKALHHIDCICLTYGTGNEAPIYLKAKAVICHAHLGNLEHAKVLLKDSQMEQAEDKHDLIIELGDTFAKLGHYDYALKFYFMLDQTTVHDNGNLHLKIAKCYVSLKERGKAIPFFYKALSVDEEHIDARITLSSLLREENKDDEAIILLSAPKNSVLISDQDYAKYRPWWLNGKVRMQLAKIYRVKGMLEDFVNVIHSIIHKTLVVESMNRKLRKRANSSYSRKRLTRNDLSERVKILEDQEADNVLIKSKPAANVSELSKAFRAKKLLAKREALREEKRLAAIAAGMEWQSEDSEDETLLPKAIEEPPLPGLLQDDENHQFILDLCKALLSLHRYLESLEIVNLTLKLADSKLSNEKKEELVSLGAQIAYNTSDPKHGYDYVRNIVQRHPYSIAAWNCYYKVVSRLRFRFTKHGKFMHRLRVKLGDCVPPMIISGNQFTDISQHQSAAREYLAAYKLQPENPLINLCIGTSLINLALGFRIQNRHLCIVQAFAFLYNYLRLCNNSQEALYNIARAYHHVGLVTLAALYYEKVLVIQEKDYALPKLPNEDSNVPKDLKPGYCNLHREAAYNLHLIYKKSGAVDLARQVLKNYCTP